VAGNYDDTSQWRLETSTGIKYKVVSLEGGFDDDTGQADLTILISSTDLYAMLETLMPPPVMVGSVSYPQAPPFPGLPALTVQGVSFKSFNSDLPIDPFGYDPLAPDHTYYGLLECHVKYGTNTRKQETSSDPQTFLEISGNATGQYLHIGTKNAKTQDSYHPNLEGGEDGDDAQGTWNDPVTGELMGVNIDPETGDAIRGAKTLKPKEVLRDPQTAATMFVPMTEWTVTWNQIPFGLFSNTLVTRLDLLMGRVNRNAFSVLFSGYPETILFLGYGYKQKTTWRMGLTETPPVSLDLKFLQKRIVWKGTIRGHNDYWVPGKGWRRLLYDGDHAPYRAYDFNFLFQV